MIRSGLLAALLAGGLAALSLIEAAANQRDSASLIAAIKSGDRDEALELAADRHAVEELEPDGTSALHWAAHVGDHELVATILNAGADPSAANRYGMTPLQLAAVDGDPELMRILLAAGAEPNATLPEGETVLMTAARTGVAESVRLLLEHGADPSARESWHGESALMWAAAENHPETVRVLVESGADVNERSARHEFEQRRMGQSILPLGYWTPLMYAARQNSIAAAQVLLESGADPDLVDPDGATALVLAIINAHYEFAAMLLETGADPNVVDDRGMGALYAAVDMNRLAIGHGRPNPQPVGLTSAVDVISMLLAHGADPNAELNATIMQRHHTAGDFSLGQGATPLLRAAKSGDLEVIRLLLDAGADVLHTMPNGSTALMYAAGLGWRDGSPAAPSFDQGTEAEAIETIDLLLNLGLDLEARNDAGHTALHVAITGRSSETIVRHLIDIGADLTAVDGNGRNAHELAESPRGVSPEVRDLMRSIPAAAGSAAALR